MYFAFKDHYEDFIVEEKLDYTPNGIWDAWHLFIEKKGINTMDIISHLTSNLPLKREDIGIAGLKDKEGITRQRITIYKKKIKSCWGENAILSLLREKCTILKQSWHESPLMVWKNIGNSFKIRLRKRETLSPELKHQLEANLEKSKKDWFPNVFGFQRFGKGNKNFKKADKIFQEGINHPDTYEVKFKLQSWGSMRFNEYAMQRREKGKHLMEWDILINSHNGFWAQVAYYQERKLHHFDYRKCKDQHQKSDFFSPDFETFTTDYNPERRRVTGPVLGWNQLLPPAWSKASFFDQEIIKKSWFLTGGIAISKKYHLYGFRRALVIKPENLERERDNQDLILSFSLPTGSYASSFLAHILKNIDLKGCISNWLTIPRITSIEEIK